MINFTYTRPTSISSAIEGIAKDPHAGLIGGGTNLVDLMKHGVMAPEKLLDISALDLSSIEKRDNCLWIGATATNTAIAEHPLVLQDYPLLSMALRAGASPQLRNMATAGGNIMQRTRCSYFYDTAMPCNKRSPGNGCSAIGGYNRMHAIFGASEHCIAVHPSDMCVALAALDATVHVQGKKNVHKIPFGDFHRLPGTTPEKDNTLEQGELIIGIELPDNGFRNNAYYLKVRDRSSYAFALVSVGAVLKLGDGLIIDARLAMGGVAHKPWRLHEAEQWLRGKKADATVFAAAASLAMKDAKAYPHNQFKLTLAPKAIAEALAQASKNNA